MRRALAALTALFNVANGVWMLLAGSSWYATIPGVSHTGPYNPHFVQDIGAAFLVAGSASRRGHGDRPCGRRD